MEQRTAYKEDAICFVALGLTVDGVSFVAVVGRLSFVAAVL